MRSALTIGLLFLLLLLSAARARQQKAPDSLRKMFGEHTVVTETHLRLSAAEAESIRARAKTSWRGDSIDLYRCLEGQKTVGYGFVDNVKGKVQLITYLVGVETAGTVVDTDVLAYRESYGGEITYDSFRKQFRGKHASDPLKAGGDIKNISGATISVRAITDGIRRVLVTYSILKDRLR